MPVDCVFSNRLVPGRVRVAVRLRPRNAEEMMADADFADCVELQPEVIANLCFCCVFQSLILGMPVVCIF